MPTLYCKPENNFANRIITIISSMRLAAIWNYHFVLVWEIDKDKSPVFHQCLSDFLNLQFDVIRQLPRGITVNLPESVSLNGPSFYKRPESACDVLLSSWNHLSYDFSDATRPKEEITDELIAFASRVLVPNNRLNDLGKFLGYHSISPDIAIHWRSGAWVIDGSGTSCLTDVKTMSNLVIRVLFESHANQIFICGSSPSEVVELANLIAESGRSADISISRATSFEPSFVNTGIAILDFLTLKKARLVINSGVTTFSSFAALLGGSELISFTDLNKVYHRRAALGTGYGL